jgi:hypothetical protein
MFESNVMSVLFEEYSSLLSVLVLYSTLNKAATVLLLALVVTPQ